ncbi:hypothetical protein CAEBREN_21122 [Caenorhabditis brenneri]|uniref:Uncharacterized protein n=1 Tax=Caenorhabditis brenneri TaxID=135651 RepID=G0PJS5_CAEBE|nr:hypothetical protein CAEBREN_21122 [Caenorhabditis brenneri]
MNSKPVKQSEIPILVAPVSRRNCKKCMTQGADILNIAAEYEELTIGCRNQLQHLTESVEFVDWERALEVAEKNGLIEMWRQRFNSTFSLSRWSRLCEELRADFDKKAKKLGLNDETKEKLAGFFELE